MQHVQFARLMVAAGWVPPNLTIVSSAAVPQQAAACGTSFQILATQHDRQAADSVDKAEIKTEEKIVDVQSQQGLFGLQAYGSLSDSDSASSDNSQRHSNYDGQCNMGPYF